MSWQVAGIEETTAYTILLGKLKGKYHLVEREI